LHGEQYWRKATARYVNAGETFMIENLAVLVASGDIKFAHDLHRFIDPLGLCSQQKSPLNLFLVLRPCIEHTIPQPLHPRRDRKASRDCVGMLQGFIPVPLNDLVIEFLDRDVDFLSGFEV